jgi:phosphoenolpyruvate synthase/pyruvate phosphate dikinase
MNTYQFKSLELKEFKPKDYQFFGLWKQGLFSACFWVSSWNPELLKRLGIKSNELGSCVLGEGNFFIKKSELQYLDKQVSDKIVDQDENFFKNMVAVANDVYSSSVEYARSYSSQEPTSENFKEFVKRARSINLLWMLAAEQFVVTAERMLQDSVVETSFPADKVMSIIPKVITPLYYQHQESFELKKEIAGRSLAEIKNDKNLWNKIEAHVKSYSWIEIANFMGEPLTIERLYEQIIHLKENDFSEDTLNISLPAIITKRAQIMSLCGYIKQAGAEYFAIHADKAIPFLRLISTKIGVTYKEFLSLRDTEIMNALAGDISTEELKTRAGRRKDSHHVIFAGRDGDALFSEERIDIDALRTEMIPMVRVGSKEINGQIGNKGKYTGPIKIIMNISDFPKMQTGDVLVSTMTTPDFVVLMHKAGAIITDIGGMLCHAAIVSREINKPCIIGTKFATQLLKDGDMVEVDADKGIVRIIK